MNSEAACKWKCFFCFVSCLININRGKRSHWIRGKYQSQSFVSRTKILRASNGFIRQREIKGFSVDFACIDSISINHLVYCMSKPLENQFGYPFEVSADVSSATISAWQAWPLGNLRAPQSGFVILWDERIINLYEIIQNGFHPSRPRCGVILNCGRVSESSFEHLCTLPENRRKPEKHINLP